MLQILHNKRCGKSRNCLAFVTESNIEFTIVNYLESPLSISDLKILIKKLGIKPIELVHQKESIWITNYKGKSMTDTEILEALAKFPILVERPILIDGDRAIIGREIVKIQDFLK